MSDLEIAGLKVSKAEELNEPSSILLYGHPKTGKSYLAASISEVPGYERVLHIDAERGSVSFAGRYKNVDVIQLPYRDIDTFNEIIDKLYSTELALQYDAVIVDTMSTLQEWAIMNYGGGHTKLEFDGWRAIAEWTMDTMWQLHHMTPLAITTYHVGEKRNNLTKETWTVPKISGSASMTVANVPDIVGRLYVVDTRDGPVRNLELVPRETKISGNRFEYLPEEPLADASMPLLWEYIRHDRTDVDEAPRTLAESYTGDDEE